MSGLIMDAYAGPGGWSEGLRMLGLADIGIEWDAAACATRAAAGHTTIRADVATYPPERFAGVWGAIFSPPCQQFSSAGKGEGRKVLDRLVGAVHAGDWSAVDPTRAAGYGHVLEVGRWVEAIGPGWVACEQVPEVLPVWRAYAERWRAMGWSTWAGVLCTADYGVPQERYRAILLARADGRACRPPAPTHAEHPDTLFGGVRPWVTMGDALGWDGELHHIRGAGMTERHGPRPGRSTNAPAFTVEGGSWRRLVLRTGANSMVTGRTAADVQPYERAVDRPAPTVDRKAGHAWWVHRPATTIVGDGRVFGPHSGSAGEPQSSNAVRLTLADVLVLQGLPVDYPVQGTKTQQHEQVGNVVPPAFAAHVIAAVTGRALDEEAAA